MSERIAILASGDLKSGAGGSTAERVVSDVLEQKVDSDVLEEEFAFDVGLVICNNARGTVGVHRKIDEQNRRHKLKGDNRIPMVTIDHAKYPRLPGDPERGLRLRESYRYQKTLERYGIDFVWLLGFMLIINGELVEARGWKPEYAKLDPANNGIYHPDATMANNHPSILPWTADTYGSYAHAKAMDLFRQGRITHSAMSYHLVAQKGVDSGPIVRVEPIKIDKSDDDESLGEKVQTKEKDITAGVINRHLVMREQHSMAANRA
jgi:folate-dependent phosphoribosylglycinamide formyltransferase PurN